MSLPGVRLAVATVLAGFGVVAVVLAAGEDGAAEPPVTDTPRGLVATCRTAAQRADMPPVCPSVLPLADGPWGNGRALDRAPCEYLIDVLAGPSPEPGGVPKRPYHLLFGARCEPFDLAAVRNRRWPAGGFFDRDLRLVGVRPGNRPRPARPRVVQRLQVAGRPALLLRYPSRPLTSVHTGHLAVVWNDSSAGYVISVHRRVPVRALRVTARGFTRP